MSIESALWTALSGLRATQAQIQTISGNVANVQTAGYSREILPQTTIVNAGSTSVSTGAVQRVVDQVLETNLTNQTTTASAASTLSTYNQQIDSLLGQVGSGATINTALNNFSSALQAAATTPQDPVAQGAAVSAGQSLAQTLNQLSAGIQSIRQGTDQAISTDIGTLNTALKTIASTNAQISQLQAEGQSTAVLEDQRAVALNQVAQFIGVSSFVTSSGVMTVTTSTGQTLVDDVGPATFTYTPAGNVSASSVLSPIKLNGIDITHLLTSGSIGALLQLRDTDLPGLTAQLNQFANNLFNATAVSASGVTFATSGGNPASGDTFTATVNGVTYDTQGLTASPSLAKILIGGGAPQAGDVFTATIDGTAYTSSALSGAGPFDASSIANALNQTLTAINVPQTITTQVPADTLDVTLNGTTYTTGAVGATPAAMLAAIQTALGGTGYTAVQNGSNIEFENTNGNGILYQATIAPSAGDTGTYTFGAGVRNTTFSATSSGNNLVFSDSANNPINVSLVKSGTGAETFATQGLPANPTMNDVANALNAQFQASTTITVGGGAPQTGDAFSATIDGTAYASVALAGAGPFTPADIANALNQTLTKIQLTPTVTNQTAGDVVNVTLNGTTYNVTLTGTTLASMASDINTAVGGAGYSAVLNGSAIDFTKTGGDGLLYQATINTQAGDTGTYATGMAIQNSSYSIQASGNSLAFSDAAGNPITVSLAKTGTGTETFAAPTTILTGGGTPQTGDTFTATINGVSFSTAALSGTGPFTSADIVNALNQTLTKIAIPMTVTNQTVGDVVQVTLNGSNYPVTMTGTTSAGMVSDINTAIVGSGYKAVLNGSNIEFTKTSGNGDLYQAALSKISGAGTYSPGLVSQATTYSVLADGWNLVFSDSKGNPTTVSLVSTGTGTETFATTTLSASAVGGNIALTNSSGNPITATIATNPMFVAGTPNNSGTPTTIDFTQPNGSFNIGQTFDVVVDGTDYGSTTALATGGASLSGAAAAIQSLFTANGLAFTASVVGGKLEIADPNGNPISASVTLSGGPGSEAFTAGTPMNPLNTQNSGLGATNDANHFFAGVNIAGGLDNAATIQVNPSLLANNALLLQAATGADPSISQNLFANLGQNYDFAAAGSFTNSITTSLGNYSSQIVGQAASTAAASKSNATFQSSLQSQIASQAASVSGVNIDEELSNLIQYQNAYGANARVMTVIQSLYDTLMRM